MQRTSPFRRVQMLMVAMAGLLAGTNASMPGVQAATREEALTLMGGYRSNGKGEGRSNRRAAGAGMAFKRAAQKRRNVLRHRKACRGFAVSGLLRIVALAAVLTGCSAIQTSPPAFDTNAITITYKSSAGEHPGEVATGMSNSASWEYWADHPTYILMGKDGAVLRMPAGDGAPALRMERRDGVVYLKP